MDRIFEIGPGGAWTGREATLGPRDGAPTGWTRQPVPPLAAGEAALWVGGGWVVGPPPDVPSTPARHEVRKLAVIERVGPDAYPAFAVALGTLSEYQRARWESARSVYSDDPDAQALLVAVGLDPAVILAPDPEL